jgi:hypothetical protein
LNHPSRSGCHTCVCLMLNVRGETLRDLAGWVIWMLLNQLLLHPSRLDLRTRVGLKVWLLLYAHRHRSILGAAGLPHYTDTTEPANGHGAQNMVTVQSRFRTRDLSITGPTRLPTALTGPQGTLREQEVRHTVLAGPAIWLKLLLLSIVYKDLEIL